MKKVLFVLAVAAAMVACGTKNAENTEATEEVVAEEVVVEEVNEPAAEAVEANAIAEDIQAAGAAVEGIINAAKKAE